MIVNLKGVSAENPNEFIKVAGTYTLKVTSIDEDGYDVDSGMLKIRIKFMDSTKKNHSELMSTGGQHAWRLKQFCDSMKAPESFNIMDLVGRYATAVMIINAKGYATVTSWKYAENNNQLPPILSVVDELEAESELAF